MGDNKKATNSVPIIDEAFNAQMVESAPSENVAAHIDTAYSNQFTQEHGNLAASAVYNTVRAI